MMDQIFYIWKRKYNGRLF